MKTDTCVAQIRLAGDADTIAALVLFLNRVPFEGVQFAIQTPRTGRKGDEHLAYGTVTLKESEDSDAA